MLLTMIDDSEGDAGGSVTIPADLNWHHIAVTVSSASSGNVTFYLDGVNTSTITYTPGTYSFGYDAAIGARSDTLGNSFYGNIDEMSVYANTVLTSSQIYGIFAAGPYGKCAVPIAGPCSSAPGNMISWWKGESGTSDTWNGLNSGTNSINVGYTTNGYVDSAFQFSGTNSLVQLSSAAILELSSFTIEGWVQRAVNNKVSLDSQGNGHIFGWGSLGYAFAAKADGTLLLTKIDYSESDSASNVKNSPGPQLAPCCRHPVRLRS